MSSGEQVEALGALYQGEKTDSIGIFNVGMVMMTIIVGYLGASLTLSEKFGTKALPWDIVIWLPFPLCLVIVYHGLVALSGMSHGIAQGIITEELFRRTGVPERLRRSAVSHRIMDVNAAPWPLAFASLFVYVGVYVAAWSYTAYIVVKASYQVPLAEWIVAVVLYAAGLLAQVGTWVSGMRIIGSASEKPDEKAAESLPEADGASAVVVWSIRYESGRRPVRALFRGWQR
ncbi:hypothetical protein ACFCV3_02105 [Kribbella sp. NPDC056345]|uniref:hypothetical protein n=1 Tax=Kribbella sp. NPDC056345 TaxID=3345789 RepID=UPI0035DD6F30